MKHFNNFYNLNSTYPERIKHTPKNNPSRGNWSNERGNSTFIPTPNQKEVISILKKFNLKGIDYINCCVDFSRISYATLSIKNMSTKRYKNFSQCYYVCANLWNEQSFGNFNNWTSHLVKKYIKGNRLTWHECNDCITCILVPTAVHAFFTHLGGISECKHKQNANT